MNITVYLVFVLGAIAFAFIKSFQESLSNAKKEMRPDIEVEQMKDLEEKVEASRQDHGIEENDTIDEIAEKLNVKISDTLDPNLEGKAETRENRSREYIVTFAADEPEPERMFTLAHECGHIINEDELPRSKLKGHDKPEEEQLADYTAAALLMPMESVSKFLQKAKYEKLMPWKRVEVVRQLCKKYNVTETSMLRRINEVYAVQSIRSKKSVRS